MSDPQAQPKSDDSMLSIAADFARVLWSPTAVFRGRRATRTWRVVFVLWVIVTLLGIPMFLDLLSAIEEVEREPGVVIATAVVAPLGAFMFVLFVASIDGAAVLLASTALGRRLPISRAVVIAAFSSVVLMMFAILFFTAVLASGDPITLVSGEQAPNVPSWAAALMLNLSPLAPESRPVLMTLLSSIGIPAFWHATLQAVGAREIGAFTRPIRFTAPVFWAASVVLTLLVVAIANPLSRWAEQAGRAAERAADTTRAPARAP